MAQSLKSNLVTCNIFNMCEKSSTLERLYCGYLNQRVIYLQKKNEQEILEWLRENVELWSHDIEEH